jgi:hypothetical protein
VKSPDYVPIQFVKKGIDMTVDRRRLLAGVPAAVVGSALFASAATACSKAGPEKAGPENPGFRS